MKKLSKGTKIFIVVLTLVVCSLAAGGLYINSLLSKTEKTVISKAPEDLGIDTTLHPEETKVKEIVNIALFGIDAPKGERGRSDAIMVMTVDNVHNTIKLSSIMRDSYVSIDGHGTDKINHAYAFGGPQLAIKTINQNFNLNIKDFITVNFSTMPDIIDAIGGVDMDIKDYEISQLSSLGITKPGHYTLNGKQALAYSRIRKTGNGDYERTDRQRAVLNEVFKKITSAGTMKFPSYVSQLLPLTETSLSNMDILKLGKDTLSVGNLKFNEKRFPQDGFCQGKMINGIYYLTFNKEETVKQMQDFIFNK